jgi:23S rRNA (uracil1939-C5)-methyltransferase
MSSKLVIERLAYGGAGIGRLNGKVCFVQGAAPGDELLVQVQAEKRSYCEATIRDILSPGPGRTQPPCPVFGQCGGCQWQHLEYGEQLRAKEAIFAQALGHARVTPVTTAPIVPAESAFGYRYRLQVKICVVRGQLLFGFYRPGTHHLVELPPQGCLLAVRDLNQAINEMRAVFTEFPEPTLIPQVDLTIGDHGGVLAILHYLGRASDAVRTFIDRHRADMPTLTGMFLQTGRKSTIQRLYGPETIQYQVPSGDAHVPCLLQVSRAGFSQVNLPLNRRLVSEACMALQPFAGERMLDIFCGNGNFSIPLARGGASIVGVESYEGSIRDARENARQAGVVAEYIVGDADEVVQSLLARNERFFAILIDPPRTGARNIAKVIAGFYADKIVYVSCDPMTLARDIAIMAADGYIVQTSRVVDMFPQTYHMESVTLLQRQ